LYVRSFSWRRTPLCSFTKFNTKSDASRIATRLIKLFGWLATAVEREIQVLVKKNFNHFTPKIK